MLLDVSPVDLGSSDSESEPWLIVARSLDRQPHAIELRWQRMLPFDEALQRIVSAAAAPETELIVIEQAVDRVLAEDLVASSPLPAFDYSAMDGYAVAGRDFSLSGPWWLSVVGESRAGGLPSRLTPGTTMRIFTGAPIPDGADAVVMQEDVTREDGRAKFGRAPARGAHIRRRGEDLAEGAVALERGTRLGPFSIGLLAAIDRDRVPVAKKPKVSVLCTGEELRSPGSKASANSIPDANAPSLSALIARAGGAARIEPRIGDDLGQTEHALRAALLDTDLLLTVGGVSVGEHDVVRRALVNVGAELDFWKVKIRPGKPLVFGRHGRALILGLPGNPVSAQLTFALFGMPLIRAMQGDARPIPVRSLARLQSPLVHNPGRTSFVRARIEADSVRVAPNQASGSAASLAHADALVIVPAECEGLAAGSYVEVLRLVDL